ncbi:MAG: hypothetical protein ACNS60_20390 [Candidatus Cyclobacteriaceae bacterium M2_1C_046]
MPTVEAHITTNREFPTTIDKTNQFDQDEAILPKVIIQRGSFSFSSGICIFHLDNIKNEFAGDDLVNDSDDIWNTVISHHHDFTDIFRQRHFLDPQHPSISVQCAFFKDLDVDQDVINVHIKRLKALDNAQNLHKALKSSHSLIEDWISIKSFDLINSFLLNASREDFSLPILVALLAATVKFKNKIPNRSDLFESASQKATSELGLEKFNKSIFRQLN